MSTQKSDGFNIGEDIKIIIRSSDGQTYQSEELGHLIDFDSQQDDSEVQVKPINGGGRTLHETIPHGYTGKMTFVRFNGKLASLIIKNQRRWYQDGIRPSYEIQKIVSNRDGSTNTELYTNVKFSKPSMGKFSNGKEVTQDFSFRASDCIET